MSILHICTKALFVALLLPDSGTGVPSVPQGQRSIPAHSLTTSLAAAQAAGREDSHLEKMGHPLQLPFSQQQNVSPSFTGTWCRKERGFVPFLLTDVLLRICTGHFQNKSPHQVCAFLRQKTNIFCGKQILKMHQIQYY